MRQSLRTALTLGVLALIVAVMAILGFVQLTKPLPKLKSEPVETALCHDEDVKAGARIAPPMVTVSVYNAGTQGGLADATMTLLAGKGFGRGETGNTDRKVRVRRAQVWVEKTPDPVARLVASYLGPKTPVVEAPTLGVGAMVVIGDNFPKKLAKGKRSVVARNATTVCRPTPQPVE